VLVLWIAAFPVAAQEAAEAAPTEAPGMTIFVVLLGLTAVLGAGGYLVWRDRNNGEG